ncbi:hypothetical protein M3J09_010248 [Ascochyta lentis]
MPPKPTTTWLSKQTVVSLIYTDARRQAITKFNSPALRLSWYSTSSFLQPGVGAPRRSLSARTCAWPY